MRTIRQALKTLSPEAVRVLVCVCIEGEPTQAQVAGITGLAPNTVKKALRELNYCGMVDITHQGGRSPFKRIRATTPTLLDGILEAWKEPNSRPKQRPN